MQVKDHLGNTVKVFAKQSGDFIDLIVREDQLGAWEGAALSAGIVAKIDADTGEAVYSRGVNVSKMEGVELVPAVLNDVGEVVTPAVMDKRLHVNVRLGGVALTNKHETLTSMDKWTVTCLSWMRAGDDAAPNNHEEGKTLLGITLIDPDTINSPKRVWFDRH